MTKQTEAPIPFSLESEESTLGAILINPALFLVIAEYLNQDDFFLVRHQWIWYAMRCIVARGDETFDYLTVAQELTDKKHLDDIGGVPYLMKLINNTPTHINGELYARLVQRASQRRQLLRASEEIHKLAINEDMEIEQVMELAEARLKDVTVRAARRTEQHVKDAMSALFDEIQMRRDKKGDFYLPTGYRSFDQFTSGLERGCVHVIAGKPGMGKTSLCMGMVLGSTRFGVRALFISNEMSIPRLSMRMAAIETGVNLQSLKRGELTEPEAGLLVESMGRMSELPLYLDYIPQTTIAQVHAKILRLQREKGLDVVFIDGLWRMQAPEFRGDTNRNSINGYLTDSLAQISKSTNVAVVLTHQLTKDIDKRQDKRPNKGDLEYGGQIDQNADVIALIYRDEVYDPVTEHPGQADIILDKNRDAPTGTITMYFDKKTTRFYDATTAYVDISSRAKTPIVINGEPIER